MLKLEDMILRQITWSHRTFGSGARVQGIARHIVKEMKERDTAPTKTDQRLEVADLFILGIDGAWRAMLDWRNGYTPAELANRVHGILMEEAYFICGSLSARDPADYAHGMADGYITMTESEDPEVVEDSRRTIAGFFCDIANEALATLVQDVGWTMALAIIDRKQAGNRARQWPAPGGEDQPVEHIKTEAAE